MKRTWLAVFAAVAALFGAVEVNAQGTGVPGGYYANQAYMFMPAGASQAMGYYPGGVAPVGYAKNDSCTSGGCTAGCTAPSCTAPGCTSPGCTSKPTCCIEDCCAEGWTNCYYAYGGFMFLRPRDAEVAYAVTANGPITPGASVVQRSPVALTDMDFQPGFFVGVGKVLDDCTSIGVQYTKFEGNTNSALDTSPPFVIRSLVAHPSTLNGTFDGLAAAAQQDIKFDLIDLDYRGLIAYDCDYKINYLLGARYGQLKQAFQSQFSFQGVQNIDTQVNFYGAGARLGLEGEKYGRGGFMFYGKTYFSALPGEFRTDYQQFNAFQVQTVDTSWRAGRIVTILDLELGVGWRSCCDTFRINAGYVFSSWNNVVQTDEWIKGVQANNYVDMSDKMTFDGFVARVEARW